MNSISRRSHPARKASACPSAVAIAIDPVLLSSLANWRAALAVALSCSILGYVVFIYFFQTRFPRGPVEQYLKGLL